MERRNEQGLSGAALKWIALGSMLIDHFGLAVFWYGVIVPASAYRDPVLRTIYVLMRSLGRPAFPIFCFLLAEGLFRTRSRARYLLRLLLFALVSELPFDLAVWGTWLEFSYQNVFFTLALGLTAAWCWEALMGGTLSRCEALRLLAAVLCAAAAMAAARFLRADYGALGVLLILVFDLLRDRPLLRDLCAAAVICAFIWIAGAAWLELFSILVLPLIHLYNGERGRQNKLFFYLAYPAHLLLFALLRRALTAF